MTDPAVAKRNRQLDKAIAELFKTDNAAFFGPLLGALKFRWTDEILTAATDGINLLWNPEDFDGCTPEGRVSTLMHELGHVFRMHATRVKKEYDRDKWAMATDIAINRDLRREKFKIDDGPWWKQGIGNHDEIPHEMEEDIYAWLTKNQLQMPQPSSGGQPTPGGNQPVQGVGQPTPSQCCSSHMLAPLDAGQQAQAVNIIVQAINTAKQNGQPGSVPGMTTELINEFLKPVVPWDAALNQWMTELLEEDTTWARPNRRYIGQGLYLPSRFTDDGRLEHLMFFIDISGSITKEQAIRILSEIKFVWEVFKPEKLTMVQFDQIIQKVDVMEEGDPFNEIEIKGRGGTSLVPVRQYIMDHQPTAAIILSDMDVRPMEEGPTCPILWIAIDAEPDVEVPFGQLIHVQS
jgi:predicted metal-dependent peptidase